MNNANMILFSGGLDSTLLLNRLAKESSKAHPVLAIACVVDKNDDKQNLQIQAEKRVREKIVKEMKKRGYHIIYKELNINLYGDSDNNVLPSTEAWIQQIWWVTAAASFAVNNSVINLSYIINDQFWNTKREFEDIIYGFMTIKNITIKVNYPLQYTVKGDIIKELKEEKLYDLCWICESPKKQGRAFIPCGKCNKCKELKIAEYALKLEEEK